MTHMEAMAALAQGVINIDRVTAGETQWPLNVIEKGSLIYRGMLSICEEEAKTIEALREVESLLARRAPGPTLAINEALAIVRRMIAERTDPEVEPAPPLLSPAPFGRTRCRNCGEMTARVPVERHSVEKGYHRVYVCALCAREVEP